VAAELAVAYPRLDIRELGFPETVLEEAKARGFSPEQIADLIDLWWEIHWYAPGTLAEVVEEVLVL